MIANKLKLKCNDLQMFMQINIKLQKLWFNLWMQIILFIVAKLYLSYISLEYIVKLFDK